MRKLAAVLFLIALAVVLYLVVPVLRPSGPVELPRAIDRASAMLAVVPSDAVDVLIVPGSGSTYWRLRRHPIFAEAIRQQERQGELRLLPWLLGNTPVVLWRSNDDSGLVAEADGIRRLLFRVLGWRSDARIEGELILRGRGGAGFPLPTLPPSGSGHLFVLHRLAGSPFPPLDRPALTAVSIGDRIDVHSQSLRRPGATEAFEAEMARLPRNAILSAAFASPPELIRRIEQTLPVQISPLLEQGGKLALYRLHDERLLPRPRGVVVLPVSDQTFPVLRRRLESLSPELPFRIAEESRRAVMGQEVVRRESFGFTLEYTRRGDELLVAFDKSSLEMFLADDITVVTAGAEPVVWCLRLDVQQLLPALERMQEHAGLRLLLPELGRAIDQFDQTIRPLKGAGEIVAVKRLGSESERLEVTIRAPK